MDTFGIVGFSFGILGFIFGMSAITQVSELKKEVEKLKSQVGPESGGWPAGMTRQARRSFKRKDVVPVRPAAKPALISVPDLKIDPPNPQS